MMTRADIYRKVGGYNEAIAVNYNDVDYCLKMIECGLTVVYAPRAELIHFKSQTRAAGVDFAAAQYFAARWLPLVTLDPFYNENEGDLTVAFLPFEIGHNPRQI